MGYSREAPCPEVTAEPDIYLYEDIPVLRNKLNIKDERELDTIEAERSRARMMIL